jgi:hypothetical protein
VLWDEEFCSDWVVVEKTEERRLLGRPSDTYEYNNTMCLEESECKACPE